MLFERAHVLPGDFFDMIGIMIARIERHTALAATHRYIDSSAFDTHQCRERAHLTGINMRVKPNSALVRATFAAVLHPIRHMLYVIDSNLKFMDRLRIQQRRNLLCRPAESFATPMYQFFSTFKHIHTKTPHVLQ